MARIMTPDEFEMLVDNQRIEGMAEIWESLIEKINDGENVGYSLEKCQREARDLRNMKHNLDFYIVYDGEK